MSLGDGVDICDNEKCTRELGKMVEAMKGAVGMDIELRTWKFCGISLYSRNGATRKARLQLAATTMSSSEPKNGTRATGDFVWLAKERYGALLEYGTKRKFTFCLAGHHRTPQVFLTLHTFVRKLGLSIVQNANSVEFLRVLAENGDGKDGFAKQLLSLDVWKEAFPSLQGACFVSDPFYDASDVSPHLRKHVRSVEVVAFGGPLMGMPPGHLDLIGSMIRKNLIEEICFEPRWMSHTKLLDDTLRSVRSFVVMFSGVARTTAWDLQDLLAMSFERTKGGGDKLERLSLSDSEASFNARAVQTIIRSRPNLQVLKVEWIPSPVFVEVCQAVASSTLTTFQCTGSLDRQFVEAAVAIVGELVQHSTVRDLDLTILLYAGCYSGDVHDFVEGVAEGLRATRLRRFHWTMSTSLSHSASMAVMTKMYESVRENRSLVDIQLEGAFWDPWRYPKHYDLTHAPPCPFSFFRFLSSRNQYLSELLMPHAYALPAGLWPLILESASSDASILYYFLTFQPHLVKGRVDGNVAADREWGVDGPGRKCRRFA